MKLKYLIIIALTNIFSSCNRQDIDNLIEKYNKEDFSKFKDRSIYFRSSGSNSNTSIYFVNSYEVNCSPYVVEVNNKDFSIIEIKNHLVLKSCDKDFLMKKEIETIINEFAKYKFYLLEVDNEGNVFIKQNRVEDPMIMRKDENSDFKEMNKFINYKGNWYIEK